MNIIQTNRKKLLIYAVACLLIPPATYIGSLLATRSGTAQYYSLLAIVLAVSLIPYSLFLFVCYLTKRPELTISKERISFKGVTKSFDIPINDIEEVKYFVFMNSEYMYFVNQKKAFSLEFLSIQRPELSKLMQEVSEQRLLPKFDADELSFFRKLTLVLK